MITTSNMSKGNKRMRKLDQRGMSAIVITMVTMVVISLIVIGFATVSRREQRQSLDRLQSSQAFYAAESGVEDAENAIRSWQNNPVTAALPIPAKDKCTSNNPAVSLYPTAGAMIVDDTYDVAYTCLTVDPTPGELQYDGIGTDAVVVPVETALPITRLRLTWSPTGTPAGTPAPTDCPTVPSAINRVFTPQSGSPNNWSCGYGVLRADLVPTGNGSGLTSGNLSSNMISAFFSPTRNNGQPGTLAYAGNTGQANVVAGNCNVAAYTTCQATFTNIPGGNTSLSLRLSSIYQPSNITVEAFTGATPQDIEGAQVEVDSTGRASDILRRIKVRIPVSQSGSGTLPTNALSSTGSICKRFSASNNYFNIPGDIVDPDDNILTGNRMCAAQTDQP